jgi:eukaryotic-like serine/threonine-protein kinase
MSRDGLRSRAVGSAAYQPLSGRGKWAERALIALAILNVIGAVSAFAAYRLYQHDVITPDELDTTDLREGLVALVTLVALIVTIVLFIRWFRRAYLNLPALGAEPLRFKSWWTIGGWFIPIANLFRPKQIANDIWRASEPDAPPSQGTSWHDDDVPPLFQWWWAFFLVGNWLDNIALRVEASADDIDSYRRAAAVTMVTDVIDAAGAVLAVLVVRRTTRRQESRAARLAELGTSPSSS